MYGISQKLKNVLKNRIKILISPILYETIDFMIDNLLVDNNSSSKYFSLISNVQSSVRQLVRNVVITTFEQVLASQAEQIDTKANNLDNLSSFGKLLSKDFGNTTENSKLKVI